jgi:palmitoyltransferase
MTPICVLIAVNMFTNYYYACTISPGFTPGPVAPGARGSPQGDSMPAGKGWNWAPQKHRSWGPDLVPARVLVCKRCGGRKPERCVVGSLASHF